MNGVCSAFSFLTIIRSSCDFSPKDAVKYFPIVGIFIGGFLYIFSFLKDPFFQIISVLWLVFITGGLHLDGLADTSDAIFSCKSKEKMLEIMRDSRVGTFGVLALILDILIKFVSLFFVKDALILVFIPSYSRFVVLYLMKKLPYGRQDGKAKVFFKEFKVVDFLIGYVVIIASFIVLPLYLSVLINTVFFIFGFLLYKYIKNKLGVVTGDILGFSIEISETLLIFIVSLYFTYI